MVAQERANWILSAWVAGNPERLHFEIDRALAAAQGSTPRSTVENEEHELLESIACELRASLARPSFAATERLESSFALLRHLSQRYGAYPLSGSCAA